MIKTWLSNLLRRRLPEHLTYEEARDVLEQHSQAMREQLAGREDAPPEMLYYLAGDEQSSVRELVAANPSTPVQADELLVDDRSAEVRCELARKIARLVPDLPESERTELSVRTLAIFEKLAQDQLPRVRQIVAEEIKNSDGVPRHIVQRLARDAEIAVCGPVLEYSPLLSDADLIEIVATTEVAGVLEAVAHRRHVSEPVADAVVATLDIPAVAALLANANAQIREETLEQIIDQAEGVELWHQPMVMRPDLSLRAVRRIAGFVARSLLENLSEQHDLDTETQALLRNRIQQRLKEDASEAAQGEVGLKAIRTAFDRGKLDDEMVAAAAKSNRRDQVILALALLADVPEIKVEQIFTAQSGKGIAALCWKADLSMRTAHTIETTVAHLPADLVVLPRNGFDYPMDDGELAWHLRYFGIDVD